MSFLETVEQARVILERNGRVSLRALQREFSLDDDALEGLVEELVEIQQVAARDGRALAWAGAEAPRPERAPRDYTPRHLAEKILQAKSAVEGERKRVTVLFADVPRSMELAEGMDPEEWHSILDHFFKILTDGVHRFEGTVNQYLGDGIMALFGAPIAHEDHAQRACWASLRIRDDVRAYADRLRVERGLNFGLRIGLNSGDVVVGKIGDDLRMDYTAQGHTVGLAQRMEQLADSGRVCVSAHTAALVEGYFELRALGEAQVKGVDQPLGIYELEGIGTMRTRLDRSRARGFSRFVGRAREMDSLEASLENALAGNGQAVGVVGEAGVGKSRLCAEFVDACRAKGIPVDEAHCPAHGKNVPYLPLLELLRNFFGIADRDSDHEARRKIAGELALLGGEFEDVLPLVFDLLGVADPERPAPDLSADVRKKRLFAFVRRLIQARSEREPSVILIDDVHWIDPGTDEFLAQAVEVAPGTRTLLLLNFRPEYSAEWTSRSWYQQLPLVPLGPEAIRELLDDLLGTDPSLVDLATRIAERTRGNPFFTEEVVQSLIESGLLAGERGAQRLVRSVDEIEIPASVHPVLGARIDRLPEREKHVLQTAAVVGKRFPQAILERVADLPEEELAAALSALEAGEFIYPEVLYPHPEYEFKHPLTQEVALDSQLAEKRRTVNDSVARALIDVYPERHDELSALIAQHFEGAGQKLDAARWYRRAARRAESSDAIQAALHWQKVRELAPLDAAHELAVESRIELLKGSLRVGLSKEYADGIYREGLDLVGNDPVGRASIIGYYGRAIGSLGDISQYRVLAQEALQLARQTDDPVALSDALAMHADSLLFAGQWGQLLEAAEEGLSRFDSPDAPTVLGIPARGWWRHFRAFGLANLGGLGEARDVLERGLEIAAELDSPDVGLSMTYNLTTVAEHAGDAAAALQFSQRSFEFCEAAGDPPGIRVWLISGLALAHLVGGRWSDAADAARAAIQMRVDERVEFQDEPNAWTLLAEAHEGAEDWEAAHEAGTHGLGLAQERNRPYVQIRALRVLALCRARLEGPSADGIDALLDRAEELIELTGTRVLRPRIVEARSKLAGQRGDPDLQNKHRREAHRLYTEIGATGHAKRLVQ